jgi:hypothetical protein
MQVLQPPDGSRKTRGGKLQNLPARVETILPFSPHLLKRKKQFLSLYFNIRDTMSL